MHLNVSWITTSGECHAWLPASASLIGWTWGTWLLQIKDYITGASTAALPGTDPAGRTPTRYVSRRFDWRRADTSFPLLSHICVRLNSAGTSIALSGLGCVAKLNRKEPEVALTWRWILNLPIRVLCPCNQLPKREVQEVKAAIISSLATSTRSVATSLFIVHSVRQQHGSFG